MRQPGGNGYCVHCAHKTAELFFIPEDIGEIRQFTSDIMVGDAQVIPIFMTSCEDVEVSSPPADLRFILARALPQQCNFPCPMLPAGTVFKNAGIFHKPYAPSLAKIQAADRSQDDFRINDFLFHLHPQCQRVGHQVVNEPGAAL